MARHGPTSHCLLGPPPTTHCLLVSPMAHLTHCPLGSPSYWAHLPVPQVILHTDHCAKKLLPWMDGMLSASERYYEAPLL